MEELTKTPETSVIRISSSLEKISKKIYECSKNNLKEQITPELDILKAQFKSKNVQLSKLSCQTIVRLVKDDVMDLNNVLNILMSQLPNSNSTQFEILLEAIIDVLLINLKRKVALLKENGIFRCQFDLKNKQHPIITVLHHPLINNAFMSNKLINICNHRDKIVKDNSVEYLRPVFLYIFWNCQTLCDSITLWNGLLRLSKTNKDSQLLIYEILSWSRLSNSTTCIGTSIMLIDTIEHFIEQNDLNSLVELSIFQALVISKLMKYSVDPEPSLVCLLRALKFGSKYTYHHYNVILILLAECLHQIAPDCLPDLLRIIAFIVVEEGVGHHCILNMCLDGIILWMSQTIFIPLEAVDLSHLIMRKILDHKMDRVVSTKSIEPSQIRYFHTNIAIAFDLAQLVESFDQSSYKDVFNFVDTLNLRSNPNFRQRLHILLRALFLSSEPSVDCWYKIYETILDIINYNNNIAVDFFMTYIFKLSNENNPEIQLELLRGLPKFAVAKDNISMIINTIRNLSKDHPSFCMDLYLRLLSIDSRTYPFLIKFLSTIRKENNDKEFKIIRAYAIREICNKRSASFGTDLISQISDILNTCTDDSGDLATSLAIEAVIVLCDNSTVNIVSTWRALSNKFRHEQRPRSLKALFKFFACIPYHRTTSPDYDKLVDNALEQLWLTIMSSDTDISVICAALESLKHFEIGSLLFLRHIPVQFVPNFKEITEYPNIKDRELIQSELEIVPGECWVKLLQKIRPECGISAADLIGHHIYTETKHFRSGIYHIIEGKPEPPKLCGLFAQSPLRAITNYLIGQSKGDFVSEPHVVTNALRAISKKFAKPIPPLNWNFLCVFLDLSFDARKYCLLIMTNQLTHSKSACRIFENYIEEFEPNCFEEDCLLLLSLLPNFCNGVCLKVLRKFAEKLSLYCFKESQLNGFPEGCLFEKFLTNINSIFIDKSCKPEVLDIFTIIIERYIDSMELNSKLFERYTETISVLRPDSIEGLTSPANWWKVGIDKLKKATIIRCYLALCDKNSVHNNSLNWLIPIVDAYEDKIDERVFFFRHLATTLHAFNNDEQSCNWCLEIIFQIQTLLAEPSRKIKRVVYLLDVFTLAIDVLSGCAILSGNLNAIAEDNSKRLLIFPESMQLLCEHVFWKEQEVKIYEFLYNLFKNSNIPDDYRTVFKNAIICARHAFFFDTSRAVWTKYIGMRK